VALDLILRQHGDGAVVRAVLAIDVGGGQHSQWMKVDQVRTMRQRKLDVLLERFDRLARQPKNVGDDHDDVVGLAQRDRLGQLTGLVRVAADVLENLGGARLRAEGNAVAPRRFHQRE
jgi:hypothetical protein